MKKLSLCWIFIFILIITGLYLTVKATYENSWDGWGFGSAQSMMSIKHWVNDGWFSHYLLFVPAGYSKNTSSFDDPNLNRHAWVNVTGSENEKRVYYTHYPSGYLFPLAFLMEMGFENRFWFRFFQILLSLGSLILLYKFFNLITEKTVAFSATLFYMISVPFLDFADSLANMPIDDFLRFLILVLSVIAVKNIENAKKYFFYNLGIWISYFALSSSSYDSTFFIFAWLVGLDIIMIRKFLWKKWLVFAGAPVLAFAAQIIQNSLYLGFSNALSDFTSAFNTIGLAENSSQSFIKQRFLQGILFPIKEAFAFFFRTRYLLIFIAILATIILGLKKIKEIEKSIPMALKYLALLGSAAFFQSFILTDNHPYKGRLLGVFASMLAGILIFALFNLFKQKNIPKMFAAALIFLTIFIWALQCERTLAYLKEWPNNIYNQEKIDFAKEMKNNLQSLQLKNGIIFSMFPSEPYGNSITVTMARYYDMYYCDMPILNFNDYSSLIKDYTYLKNKSDYPFSAIIITPSQTTDTAPEIKKEDFKLIKIQNKDILIIP